MAEGHDCANSQEEQTNGQCAKLQASLIALGQPFFSSSESSPYKGPLGPYISAIDGFAGSVGLTIGDGKESVPICDEEVAGRFVIVFSFLISFTGSSWKQQKNGHDIEIILLAVFIGITWVIFLANIHEARRCERLNRRTSEASVVENHFDAVQDKYVYHFVIYYKTYVCIQNIFLIKGFLKKWVEV